MATITIPLPSGCRPQIAMDSAGNFQVVCGTVPVPPLPPPVVSARYFGYFGSQGTQFAETFDHVNLHFLPGWGEDGRFTEGLIACHKAGVKVMLFPYLTYRGNSYDLTQLKALLEAAKVAGHLDSVVAVYPIDEPDINGLSGDVVVRCNAAIRAMLASYYNPPTPQPALACFYGDRGMPGIESYDWVGMDKYENSAPHDIGSSEQRLMIIPGGADPWRQTPDQHVQKLNSDPRVVALIPFIWLDHYAYGPNLGIKSNGLAGAYRAAGVAIKGGA